MSSLNSPSRQRAFPQGDKLIDFAYAMHSREQFNKRLQQVKSELDTTIPYTFVNRSKKAIASQIANEEINRANKRLLQRMNQIMDVDSTEVVRKIVKQAEDKYRFFRSAHHIKDTSTTSSQSNDSHTIQSTAATQRLEKIAYENQLLVHRITNVKGNLEGIEAWKRHEKNYKHFLKVRRRKTTKEKEAMLMALSGNPFSIKQVLKHEIIQHTSSPHNHSDGKTLQFNNSQSESNIHLNNIRTISLCKEGRTIKGHYFIVQVEEIQPKLHSYSLDDDDAKDNSHLIGKNEIINNNQNSTSTFLIHAYNFDSDSSQTLQLPSDVIIRLPEIKHDKTLLSDIGKRSLLCEYLMDRLKIEHFDDETGKMTIGFKSQGAVMPSIKTIAANEYYSKNHSNNEEKSFSTTNRHAQSANSRTPKRIVSKSSGGTVHTRSKSVSKPIRPTSGSSIQCSTSKSPLSSVIGKMAKQAEKHDFKRNQIKKNHDDNDNEEDYKTDQDEFANDETVTDQMEILKLSNTLE